MSVSRPLRIVTHGAERQEEATHIYIYIYTHWGAERQEEAIHLLELLGFYEAGGVHVEQGEDEVPRWTL